MNPRLRVDQLTEYPEIMTGRFPFKTKDPRRIALAFNSTTICRNRCTAAGNISLNHMFEDAVATLPARSAPLPRQCCGQYGFHDYPRNPRGETGRAAARHSRFVCPPPGPENGQRHRKTPAVCRFHHKSHINCGDTSTLPKQDIYPPNEWVSATIFCVAPRPSAPPAAFPAPCADRRHRE